MIFTLDFLIRRRYNINSFFNKNIMTALDLPTPPTLTNLLLDAAANHLAQNLQSGKDVHSFAALPPALQGEILDRVQKLGMQFDEKAAEALAKYLLLANPDKFSLSNTIFPIKTVLHFLGQGSLATAKVHLKGAKLDEEDLMLLFEADPTLESISLEEGTLSDEAVDYLAKVIVAGKITSLSLSFIPLSTKQATLLAEALAHPK